MATSLMRDLRCVVERDPAARGRWEVALLYSGLHAVWAHRASHWMWGRGARFPARALSQASRFLTGVEIHPAARIGEGLFIDHGMGVVIGETTRIGQDVTLYHGVTLGGTSLDPGKRHPTVCDRVTIGAGAKVLGPVVIGHDSRIGSNAVVVKSVSDNSVVVGVPGQVIARSRPHTAVDRPDLDNAQVPDLVGVALHSLLARVDRLEVQVSGHAEEGEIQMHDIGVWETSDYSI